MASTSSLTSENVVAKISSEGKIPPPPSLVHDEKPKKFNGSNFKRWQQKMFYLTTLNLAKFLTEDAPKLSENEFDPTSVAVVDAWKHSDFICKNYILNGLDNKLYDVYRSINSAKALWEALDRKYKIEDTGLKKFVVGKFLDFKMVDSKTVISQVKEFQLILHEILAEGMVLSESFQMAAIIEKLLPSWNNFKNYLKHKRKEMGVENLILRLRIEEDNKLSIKKASYSLMASKANVVEHVAKTHNKNQKKKLGVKGKGIAKKFNDECFICNKT